MLRRFAAALIDYGLYAAFFYAYLVTFAEIRQGDYIGTRNIFHQLVLLSAWVILFPVLEATLGYTLGKGLFDLKAVQGNSKKPTFFRALTRHMFDPIDIVFFLVIGAITIRRTSYPRRLGDFVAGTEIQTDE